MFSLLMIYILLSIGLGIMLAYMGEKRFRSLTTAGTFLLLSLIGLAMLTPKMSFLMASLFSFISAAILAVCTFYFASCRHFLFGFCFGCMISVAVLSFFAKSLTAWYGIAIILLSGAVLGVLSIIYRRFLSILSTSFVGAFFAVCNFMLLTIGFESLIGIYRAGSAAFSSYGSSVLGMLTHFPTIFLISLSVVGILGVILQFLITAPRSSGKKRR